MLAEVGKEYPQFRPEEIQFHRANALDLIGDTSEAIKVYDETLARYPDLVDNYVFMSRKLFAETRDSSSYERYLRERLDGHKIRTLKQGSR
jgi:hypothetical protein